MKQFRVEIEYVMLATAYDMYANKHLFILQ